MDELPWPILMLWQIPLVDPEDLSHWGQIGAWPPSPPKLQGV